MTLMRMTIELEAEREARYAAFELLWILFPSDILCRMFAGQ